jgi:hypothetical protein
VEALDEHTVLLSEGSELPADVVVYATGYDGAPAAKVLPEEIAHRGRRRWGFGSESATTRARGRVSCATSGSRRNRPVCGSIAMASARHDLIHKCLP